MLDFLLPFVDVGFLVVQTAFAAVMVSTIKNQFQAKASTVTLVTSLTFFAGLIALSLFQVALALPLAAASAFGSALLWGVVAGQRAAYGRKEAEGEEIPLFLTYSLSSYPVDSTVVYHGARVPSADSARVVGEIYRVTRIEEIAPTQMQHGRQARCWQLYGRMVGCAST